MYIYKDVLGIIIMLAVVIANYFHWIPIHVFDEGSSDIYPRLLNGVLLAFLVCYTAEFIYRCKNGKKLGKFRLELTPSLKVVGLLVGMFLWTLGMEYWGFSLPTMVFLCFASLLYSNRSVLSLLLLSIVSPLAVATLFVQLNTTLPQGYIENWIIQMLS